MCEPSDPTDYPRDSCRLPPIRQYLLVLGGRNPCENCIRDRALCNGWPKETFEEIGP